MDLPGCNNAEMGCGWPLGQPRGVICVDACAYLRCRTSSFRRRRRDARRDSEPNGGMHRDTVKRYVSFQINWNIVADSCCQLTVADETNRNLNGIDDSRRDILCNYIARCLKKERNRATEIFLFSKIIGFAKLLRVFSSRELMNIVRK